MPEREWTAYPREGSGHHEVKGSTLEVEVHQGSAPCFVIKDGDGAVRHVFPYDAVFGIIDKGYRLPQ